MDVAVLARKLAPSRASRILLRLNHRPLTRSEILRDMHITYDQSVGPLRYLRHFELIEREEHNHEEVFQITDKGRLVLQKSIATIASPPSPEESVL